MSGLDDNLNVLARLGFESLRNVDVKVEHLAGFRLFQGRRNPGVADHWFTEFDCIRAGIADINRVHKAVIHGRRRQRDLWWRDDDHQ